jgi:hypothetical protein
VLTIFATSQTFDTSFSASMHTLILSWQVVTIEGTDERI